jgi:hypothetical protein
MQQSRNRPLGFFLDQLRRAMANEQTGLYVVGDELLCAMESLTRDRVEVL